MNLSKRLESIFKVNPKLKGIFLNDTQNLNLLKGVSLDVVNEINIKEITNYLSELFICKLTKIKKRYLSILVVNLLFNWENNQALSIRYYKGKKISTAGVKIIREIRNHLSELSYINVFPGYSKKETRQGRVTCVAASSKLVRMFFSSEFHVKYKPEKENTEGFIKVRSADTFLYRTKNKKRLKEKTPYSKENIKINLKSRKIKKLIEEMVKINTYQASEIKKTPVEMDINLTETSYVNGLECHQLRSKPRFKSIVTYITKTIIQGKRLSIARRVSKTSQTPSLYSIEPRDVYTYIKKEKVSKISNVKTTTRYIKARIINNTTHRSFNKSVLTLGGRLYGGVQTNLPKEIRKTINFGGQETIELDFSALHPSMLYNMNKLPVPDNIYDFSKHRTVAKICFLLLLNCDTLVKAKKAIRYNKKVRESDIKSKELNTLIDDLLLYHKPIANVFFKPNLALKLQYIDSCMLVRIMLKLTDLNILSLPVHDSLIVLTKHKETTTRIMQEEYFRDHGFNPVINS